MQDMYVENGCAKGKICPCRLQLANTIQRYIGTQRITFGT